MFEDCGVMLAKAKNVLLKNLCNDVEQLIKKNQELKEENQILVEELNEAQQKLLQAGIL